MSSQRSWFSSHPPVMTKGGVPEPPSSSYTGYQLESGSQGLPMPPSMPAEANVGHLSDRVIIPRKWTGGHDKKQLEDNDDDDNSENDDDGHGSKKDQGGKDKRGNYKCGRCGEPKKGHICRNKPRLRTAVVETCDTEAQVELDPSHTVRQLSLHIQGYPESYGLTYTWTGMPFPQYGGGRATILPPYIPHIQASQMPMMGGGGGGGQYPVSGGQPYPSMGMGQGGQGMMLPPGSAQPQPPPPQIYMPGQGGGQSSKSHRHHHSQGTQQDVYGGTPPANQQYYA